ncbi:MAG: hypothetical protein M1412_01780 [Deltaproteobacteria bacterium]|nr:hypothetical protein [Deltaproteobacteria bacterium]MCL5891885.1 hypothetical protein [Deltaproteobacteria bacterium]
MKKIKLTLIGLTIGVLGLGLYGCAKNNPVVNYHSYSYYKKHRKQAKATYEACEKIPAFVKQDSKKFDLSKENENCFNAKNIVKHYGNTLHKNFFNAARKHFGMN